MQQLLLGPLAGEVASNWEQKDNFMCSDNVSITGGCSVVLSNTRKIF
jgi:hypothetical protein